MKKDNFNRNAYNKRLLIFLVAITVIVCAALVAVVILTDRENNAVQENPPVDASAEENIGEGEAELPETTPEESEPEPESDPEPEEPEPPKETSDWNLILANPWNKLPEDFTVELAEIGGGHKVDARIVDDLNQMMSDLRSAGHSAFVCSSYRTNAHQTNLYNNEVNDYRNMGYSEEDAAVEAGKWVAVPGTSEHQTGLAIDIMSSYYLVLDKGQEDTAEQQWLMENSYKYGFILRYPSDKSEITGIYYEPWHYRYVGKDAAKEIYEKGICFEEYLLL
ncbi:MAG: M15 family metallopeptidase [Clostridia bacterium]|nr:M15 family metallopeptidase [Clostridia bacterium]